MKKIITVILSITFSLGLFAQTTFWENDSVEIGTWQNQQFVDAEGNILYAGQGNMIFDGQAVEMDKLIWALDGESFFEKKKAEIYDQNGDLIFHIKKGEIYYKTYLSNYMQMRIQKTEDFIALYNTMNDSLLGYTHDITASNGQLLAWIHFTYNQNQLLEQWQALTQVATSSQNTSGEIIGAMESIYGNPIVWLWDGKYLQMANNNDINYVWEFDGELLKPAHNSRMQNEWSWDGETLSPYWGGSPQQDWRWQGEILRQVWNDNYQNEFIFDGEIARRRFGSLGQEEWQISGTIPKPLIAAVLLGIVYR